MKALIKDFKAESNQSYVDLGDCIIKTNKLCH